MNFDSFGDLAKEFGQMARKTPAASKFAMEHGGKAVERTARSKFGAYQEGWAPLATSTQVDRALLGFTSNDPLFRTGALRDAVKAHAVESKPGSYSVFVGVKDGDVTLHSSSLMFGNGQQREVDAASVMAVQEFGNEHVPPRPIFLTVARDDGELLADAIAIETLSRIGLTSEV